MGVALVQAFITGLLFDLQTRMTHLRQLLEEKSLIESVEQHAAEIRRKLDDLTVRVVELRSSDYIREAVLLRQAYEEYQDICREAAIIEQFAMPVLLRFDQRDERASRLMRAIVREVGLSTQVVPLVSTTSSQYYWAKPEVGIIAMPAGDLGGMLGWPDLFHELSHILLNRWPDFLSKFAPVVTEYYKKRRQELADISGGRLDNKRLLQAQMKWHQREEGTWQIEMAANLISTYLVGPSFGWQHIRLFTNHSNTPFSPAPGDPLTEHPADQAQLDGIVTMLSLLKCDQERQDIQSRWQAVLQVTGEEIAPQGYDLYYPSPVIHGIAKVVFDSCRAHGLISFVDRVDDGIVSKIDRAWMQFNVDSSGYPEWESATLREIEILLESGL